MIIYYGSYSTTGGKEYLIGYKEGNACARPGVSSGGAFSGGAAY